MIFHPDRSDNYLFSPAEPSWTKTRTIFSVFLPPISYPVVCSFFMPCVVEVCNFHETQQIMPCNTACEAASYLWGDNQPLQQGKWNKRKCKAVYVLLYAQFITIQRYLWYKYCILTHKKCWLIDRWIFPPIVTFWFSENFPVRLFWTVFLTSCKTCSRPSPVMPQEDFRVSVRLVAVLVMPSWLDIFSTGTALGRSCLFAITIMGTPNFSVSFITLCSSNLASSSLSESALSKTKNMRSVLRV